MSTPHHTKNDRNALPADESSRIESSVVSSWYGTVQRRMSEWSLSSLDLNNYATSLCGFGTVAQQTVVELISLQLQQHPSHHTPLSMIHCNSIELIYIIISDELTRAVAFLTSAIRAFLQLINENQKK